MHSYLCVVTRCWNTPLYFNMFFFSTLFVSHISSQTWQNVPFVKQENFVKSKRTRKNHAEFISSSNLVLFIQPLCCTLGQYLIWVFELVIQHLILSTHTFRSKITHFPTVFFIDIFGVNTLFFTFISRKKNLSWSQVSENVFTRLNRSSTWIRWYFKRDAIVKTAEMVFLKWTISYPERFQESTKIISIKSVRAKSRYQSVHFTCVVTAVGHTFWKTFHFRTEFF